MHACVFVLIIKRKYSCISYKLFQVWQDNLYNVESRSSLDRIILELKCKVVAFYIFKQIKEYFTIKIQVIIGVA